MGEKEQAKSMSKSIEQHLIVEDFHLMSLPKDVQLKIGAFLTQLMCNTLKYNVGNKSYLLLKPQIIKAEKTKYMGYVIFNKSFIENFIVTIKF